MPEVLKQPYTLEYAYKRSLGPVLSGFFSALQNGRIVGVKTEQGRVLCPPCEYDPQTGAAASTLVDVGPGGVVQTWSWVHEPRPNHPLDRPFAFALILLDGADTPLLHVVDAPDLASMRNGMRVGPRWKIERGNGLRDIEAFVLEADAVPAPPAQPLEITRFKSPVKLDYTIVAGVAQTRFLRAITEGRLIGERGHDGKVYVPSKGVDPVHGTATIGEVPVADVGTVTTFCIIAIPFEGQALTPPYVAGSILLDGADLPLFHLVGGVDPALVRMGMRVKAVWRDQLEPTLASIAYFEPADEPDAAFDTYAEHL